VGFVIGEDVRDRGRERGQRGLHLVQAFLDALGDGDFAFAGQQFDRAHLTHVHAHGIGRTTAFAIERGERGGGFFCGGFIDFAARTGFAGEQQGFGVGRDFVHRDAHAVDHADDVFDLLRVDHVVGEVVVDFGVGQVALFQALADQLFDVGLGRRTFVGHGVDTRGVLREPSIIPAEAGTARREGLPNRGGMGGFGFVRTAMGGAVRPSAGTSPDRR
jgi:hypothetical protein